MTQNSTGFGAVTAAGQLVGFMMDKRFSLARGSELVTNGDFANGTTGWSVNGAHTISPQAGRCRITGAGAGFAHCWTTSGIPTVVGVTYEVTMSFVKGTSGNGYCVAGNTRFTSTFTGSVLNTSGLMRLIFRATATTTYVGIAISTAAGGEYSEVDDISVRELYGYHAVAANNAQRPEVAASPTRLNYDAVDDKLQTIFPNLGSNVTIARSVPGVGASILTGQTIGAGAWDDNTDHCGVVIINRALTAPEAASLTAYLNAKAGV